MLQRNIRIHPTPEHMISMPWLNQSSVIPISHAEPRDREHHLERFSESRDTDEDMKPKIEIYSPTAHSEDRKKKDEVVKTTLRSVIEEERLSDAASDIVSHSSKKNNDMTTYRACKSPLIKVAVDKNAGQYEYRSYLYGATHLSLMPYPLHIPCPCESCYIKSRTIIRRESHPDHDVTYTRAEQSKTVERSTPSLILKETVGHVSKPSHKK